MLNIILLLFIFGFFNILLLVMFLRGVAVLDFDSHPDHNEGPDPGMSLDLFLS